MELYVFIDSKLENLLAKCTWKASQVTSSLQVQVKSNSVEDKSNTSQLLLSSMIGLSRISTWHSSRVLEYIVTWTRCRHRGTSCSVKFSVIKPALWELCMHEQRRDNFRALLHHLSISMLLASLFSELWTFSRFNWGCFELDSELVVNKGATIMMAPNYG